MNELIKISYNGEQPTVSGRELHEFLEQFDDFQCFFIEVCKLKLDFERKELNLLQTILPAFSVKFGANAITYLSECISCEKMLPLKLGKPRVFFEKEMQQKIVDRFSDCFPNYRLAEKEFCVGPLGRIDILATDISSGRPVIIELKKEHKNPTQQLIAYSQRFENPILIGITAEAIPENKRHPDVTYLIYADLKI